MKQRFFLSVLLSLLCFGCGEDEGVTIEDLYAQPLEVIQECVKGKWKIYVVYGGIAGENYIENTFVDIYDDHYTITNHDGMQLTRYFTWERRTVHYGQLETWVMWDTQNNQTLWYFASIENGILSVGSDPPPNISDYPSGWDFIRVK